MGGAGKGGGGDVGTGEGEERAEFGIGESRTGWAVATAAVERRREFVGGTRDVTAVIAPS